jgi:hypothetical protein
LQYTPNLRYLQFKAFRSSDLLDVLERLPASQEWAAIEARIRLDPTGSDELPWSAMDAALVPLRTLMRFDLFLLASYSRTAHETSAFTPQTRLLMPLANTRRILG